MRYSRYFIPTLKENPQDAESKSHRLMLRAGLIRRLASGVYSYLPLGKRVLAHIEAVIRSEMNRIGALEVLLPAIQPVELWDESGRREILGEDLIQFKDRHGKVNVLGPTHEEVITDLVRKELRSYRQFPLILYQIQTKFRDEVRPRSGVIRSREFLMKDAYSFHTDEKSLNDAYEMMRDVYQRIFSRLGLRTFMVEADPGAMGGGSSHEFVLFSPAGEDRVVQYGDSAHVVSLGVATRKLRGKRPDLGGNGRIEKVHTPNQRSVQAVSQALKKKPSDLVKTMIYEMGDEKGAEGKRGLFAVLVRGDHEVSDFKVMRFIHDKAVLASPETIDRLGSSFGFSGPLGLGISLYLDEDILDMKNFVTGANVPDHHLVNVNLADIYSDAGSRIQVGDYRLVVEGDMGEWNGRAVKIELKDAIELGHIFKLNLRYSEPMSALFRHEDGRERPLLMGCYGIGLNRLMAAAIEQDGDAKGIVWSSILMSPFESLMIAVNTDDEPLREAAEELYGKIKAKGIEILFDDRPVTAGVKFNDADLLGIPIQVILGPKNVRQKKIEIKLRQSDERLLVAMDQATEEIFRLVQSMREQAMKS